MEVALNNTYSGSIVSLDNFKRLTKVKPADDIEFITGNFERFYRIEFTESEFNNIKVAVGQALEIVTSAYDANEREEFYLLAIRNLLKSKAFLGLSLQLAEGDISDDEFDKEIENNPEKYVIEVSSNFDTKDVKHVIHIMNSINEDMSVSDVAELFSMDVSKFVSVFK